MEDAATSEAPGRYVVCPKCDALYRARSVPKGGVAACVRCHTVLAAPRRKAGMLIICLALATLILIVAAIFFPFLTLETRGFSSSASLLDIALSFSGGGLRLLVFLMLAVVLALPAMRAALLTYVLVPLVFDRPPRPLAAPAFRMAANLKPWAMAEVFGIGCAVALVKITDLAQVALGQAFWMFSVLVALVVIQDRFLCSWSVWNALSPRKTS
ncbi:MAG: paraquat-inducible protein A [Silicimonas sp.]|jgi:paraquat-inducible protein A|nr:paraquat-inducible protein A [Silicimonas sp.]